MAEFTYNSTKSISVNYISFELNCVYHSKASYKKDFDTCSQSKSANKIVIELRDLIVINKTNL